MDAVAAAGGAVPVAVEAASAEEAERLFAAGDVEFILGWEPVAADGAATPGSGTKARLAARGLDAAGVSAVWTSPPVRFGPHAVRTDLDAEPKRLLSSFLSGLKDRQPEVYDLVEFHRQGGFVAADHEAYRYVVETVGALAAAPPP